MMWLDREQADRLVEGLDFNVLTYDPDTGLYRLNGEPFSGARKTRWPKGTLRSLTQMRNGVAHGISVGWYENGQIRSYSEMENDVYHGWHIVWNEDGTKRAETH